MIDAPLQHINDNKGFSLVELLVVLTLIGVLSVFVMSSYFFASESIYTWRSNLKLENSIHPLLSGIAEDIYKSEQIVEIDDQVLLLKMIDGTANKYHLENGNLMRGGTQLQGDNLIITALDFSSLSDKPGNDFWDEEESEDQDFKTVLIQLSITNGEDTLASKRAISLRNPSLWNPLEQ